MTLEHIRPPPATSAAHSGVREVATGATADWACAALSTAVATAASGAIQRGYAL